MVNKKLRLFVIVSLIFFSAGFAQKTYLNEKLSINERVTELIKSMTLEEKVMQMQCLWVQYKNNLLNEDGTFSVDKAKEYFKDKPGIGQIGLYYYEGGGPNPEEMATITNEMQKFVMENNRLGIPAIFHIECLHGYAAVDGTSYPVPIALASSFDTEMVENVFKATALEARSSGAHQALTPVVDVAKDPRWGRVEETYGEDPYLVAEMGKAVVKGFQGNGNYKSKKNIFATLKHFAAYGAPEAGTNVGPANISERQLREDIFYPFKEIIQKTGAKSVMAAYNEIDGIPAHGDRWLLKDVLRDEWKFNGFVVSDYGGVRQLESLHRVVADKKGAAKLAAEAGINIELPDPNCYPFLTELVRNGELEEKVIDDLIYPMLKAKFEMGLFDDPYVDTEFAKKIVGNKEHKNLAKEAARRSIVLLKNENVLPIKQEKIKTIAVIGPNAARPMPGCYSGTPDTIVTMLEGIKSFADKTTKVLYSEGCRITESLGWDEGDVKLSNPEEDEKRIQEAVKIANKSDLIIVAIGGNEQTCREAWSLTHYGDRANIHMVGKQDELVRRLKETGKPAIAVLFNGRPLAIPELSKNADALLECWYLGQFGGSAIAEVLFGKVNPGGKLPISIPRTTGHIPSYYNIKPSSKRGYLFEEKTALYNFGYGLSYTAFEIGEPIISKPEIRGNENLTVSVEIKNIGEIKGDEVVQLYIRDLVSSVTRPVKILRDFKRITLNPQESKKIEFQITPEKLSFYNVEKEFVLEPGEFEIMVGNSSADKDLKKIKFIVK